jgi:hypothetical protein
MDAVLDELRSLLGVLSDVRCEASSARCLTDTNAWHTNAWHTQTAYHSTCMQLLHRAVANAVVIDPHQRACLHTFTQARCGVEGNAALLRYVNANLVDIHRKLQAR